MILCYNLPTGADYLIGPPALSGILLQSRSPRERTRLQFPSGAQTTATTVAIVADPVYADSRAFSPRGGYMLSVKGLPVGMKVTIRGFASGTPVNLGGNSMTQRLGLLPDGTTGLYWVFDAGLPATVTSYRLDIYNDVNGSVAVPPSTVFELGEVNIAPGVFMDHEVGWKQGRTMQAKLQRSLEGQVFGVVRPSWRIKSIKPIFGNEGAARGSTLDNGMDYETLLATIAADPYILVFDVVTTPDLTQRSGMFGICTKLPSIESLAGAYYQLDTFDFEEVPS